MFNRCRVLCRDLPTLAEECNYEAICWSRLKVNRKQTSLALLNKSKWRTEIIYILPIALKRIKLNSRAELLKSCWRAQMWLMGRFGPWTHTHSLPQLFTCCMVEFILITTLTHCLEIQYHVTLIKKQKKTKKVWQSSNTLKWTQLCWSDYYENE